ncbi:MAG: hypothetical protein ACPG47_02250 [Leucothrix sp.]
MSITNPVTESDGEALKRGIDNLLLTCVGLQSGHSLLIVREPATEKIYCPTVAEQVAARANELGATVTVQSHEMITEAGQFPSELIHAMDQADHTVFMSRIGDYSRFVPLSGRSSKTQCYALNAHMLASHYAGACYKLMTQLYQKFEAELMAAKHWHFSCPLGTDLCGSFNWPSQQGGEDDEFSLQLFPVTTFKPVPCDDASGQVALSRWLLPGGVAKVEPAHIDFDGVVMATVDDGYLTGFEGPQTAVRQINDHTDFIANSLNINRNRLHSWHAGLNPHTFFDGCIINDLMRWEGTSFASPRYLHVHTCGDAPPGEIAWSVFNPTVVIDGETYWQDGQFIWYQRDDNQALIAQVAGAECLLEMSRCIKV